MPIRVAVVLVLACLAIVAPAAAQTSAAADDVFAGADACRPCHVAIHEAWSRTKHARALRSLSAAYQAREECVTCHITALPGTVAAQLGAPRHPNVQCEACHGPGRDHVATQPALAGLVARPGEAVCVTCHNAKSPSFKGFFFAGMKAFVHRP
ncbi:MAG: multiheme c-type cytochrome [Acidobacteriota bacterium]